MIKTFISYNEIRNNALKLIHKVYTKDNFIPDVIYVCLRGGAYIGNIISEYYKLVSKESDKKVFYAAVVAKSYVDLDDIENRETIIVDGWTYDIKDLKKDFKVMLIDDIYDSGYTSNTLINMIIKQGLDPNNIKLFVHDYKVYTYKKQLSITPDYYCFKHMIETPDKNNWVHYLSHELLGLTQEDIDNYYSEDKEVKKIIEYFNLKGEIKNGKKR